MARLPYKEVAQMRKFLALAALLALSVTPAFATGPAQQWLWANPITWRHLTATTSASALDSSVVRNGSTTAQATYDTTVAWPLDLAELPEYQRVADTAVDSLTYIAFRFMPSGTTTFTAGFDSVGVQAQVSNDGTNWTDVTPTTGFDATRTTGNDKAVFIPEQSANSNAAIAEFKVVMPATGGLISGNWTGGTAPTWKTLWGNRFIRFIAVDCGYTGEFVGQVGYWTSRTLTQIMNQ